MFLLWTPNFWPGFGGRHRLVSELQVISHWNKPRLSGLGRGLGLRIENRKIRRREVECDCIVGLRHGSYYDLGFLTLRRDFQTTTMADPDFPVSSDRLELSVRGSSSSLRCDWHLVPPSVLMVYYLLLWQLHLSKLFYAILSPLDTRLPIQEPPSAYSCSTVPSTMNVSFQFTLPYILYPQFKTCLMEQQYL